MQIPALPHGVAPREMGAAKSRIAMFTHEVSYADKASASMAMKRLNVSPSSGV
jgi:hypothetical protein